MAAAVIMGMGDGAGHSAHTVREQVRQNLLGPDGNELGPGCYQLLICVHPPRYADNSDAAFNCVAHISNSVRDQHDLVLTGQFWSMVFDIGWRALTVHQVFGIRKKASHAGPFVRLHITTEDMAETVL
jgi:hypothetical protein